MKRRVTNSQCNCSWCDSNTDSGKVGQNLGARLQRVKFSHPKNEMEQRLQAIGPVGAAQEQVPSLYGEDRTALPRHEFLRKFILSRLWERERIDEIAVPWTHQTQNINISQGFLLLTPTGEGFEPQYAVTLEHHLTTRPHETPQVCPHIWESGKTLGDVSVQTMLLKNGWGCRTFQNASYIHWFSIYSVWAPWSVLDRHMAAH